MGKFSINSPALYNAHSHRVEAYARKVRKLFGLTCNEVVKLKLKTRRGHKKLFSFADQPHLTARAKKIFDAFGKDIKKIIETGVEYEWDRACWEKDSFIKELARFTGLDKKDIRSYGDRNLNALKAFKNRTESGMDLSQRVWNYTDQFKREMELGLSVGIAEGKPAAVLAQDLKEYLNEPDKLFRRVRNVFGGLALSKAAREYHPGQGVYRSSFKNAMRLTRTETNMAYRESDYLRWNALDFVVGVEVHLSNNHTLNGKPFFDICDTLQGKYPKDFKFIGWHPQCRCIATPVLMTEKELVKTSEMIMQGEDISGYHSKNEVTELPKGFNSWVETNKAKIGAAMHKGTVPYFLLNNTKYINLDSFELPQALKNVIDARGEYLAHNTERWRRDYFNKENGGYLVSNRQRIAFASQNKQERAKFKKEFNMAQVYAQNGFKIEILEEVPRVPSPDVTINGIKADLKQLSGHNNIEREAKSAVRKQGAEMVLFEFGKNTKKIQEELDKLKREGIKVYYYFTNNKTKIHAL
jgi:hypothetical protein